MIELKGLSKSYGDKIVVDDVCLKLPAGGITSIVGANGAGKSTLLSIISRLLPMTAGTVTVDGLDVTRTPSDVLARRFSILRQDNHMISRLTVRDLVAFGRYPYSMGQPTVEDARRVDQALGFLDLDLDELSGGQRQRAFVAMVLCQDTDYALIDEPLNNLDMKHAASMIKLLRRAANQFGKTIVLVLHDINFASCYSDHIVAMRDGKVTQQDLPPRSSRRTFFRTFSTCRCPSTASKASASSCTTDRQGSLSQVTSRACGSPEPRRAPVREPHQPTGANLSVTERAAKSSP